MGRRGRLGHNPEARKSIQASTVKNVEPKSKIVVDIPGVVVLPEKKKKLKTKEKDVKTTEKNTKKKKLKKKEKKPLSKKQRKILTKVMESKQKKEKRVDLLERLNKVQAKPEEMARYISTAEMQTESKKRKRKCRGEEEREQEDVERWSMKRIKRSDDESSSSSDESEEDVVAETSESSEESETESASVPVAAIVESVSVVVASSIVPVTPTLPSTASLPQHTTASGSMVPTSSSSSGDAVPLPPYPPLSSASDDGKKRIFNVSVKRKPDIQKKREQLPIYMEEQKIVEYINENPVVIICGETGSGKTTQVPQFLYEAAYAHNDGIIGVTQPRRVAATCMSKRVAEELNLSTKEVSYQIRFEGNTTPDTKIKFMTDGVLVREIQKDFHLKKYNVIIIDEAHERSVHTDILIGYLSRLVRKREQTGNPLKLVLMSATLRLADFTENRTLFSVEPPVIQIPGRQFPVTKRYNRVTPNDYLTEAYQKICKIHRKLPAGGILVFVTSQQEIHTLCLKIRRAFPFASGIRKSDEKQGNAGGKVSAGKTGKWISKKRRLNLPKIDLDDYSKDLPTGENDHDATTEDDQFDDDDDMLFGDDGEMFHDDVYDSDGSICAVDPIYALPFYSRLAQDKQNMVFQAPPSGCRLCVIATNAAETSITIPGIKYVVDTGKVKTKVYDCVTGVSTFRVTWVSKASADQRAGRAGRTAEGHCYRLYSSAVYEEFQEFTPPEITQMPLEDLVLQMKVFGFNKTVNFPFPTPPDIEAIKAAEKKLLTIGAVELAPPDKKRTAPVTVTTYRLTELGRVLSMYPVAPGFANMLVLSHEENLMPYSILIVAALSVEEIFIESEHSDENEDDRKTHWKKLSDVKAKWAAEGNYRLLGDVAVFVNAVCAFERETGSQEKFCEVNRLHYKTMLEIRKLRRQLTEIVNSIHPECNVTFDPALSPPTDDQAKLLRQLVVVGQRTHVARKMTIPEGVTVEEAKKYRYAYQDMNLADPVYVHPYSVLFRTHHEFVVYQSIHESSKLFMRGVTVVEPDWLPVIIPRECRFSTPQEDPPPFFKTKTGRPMCYMTSNFGPHFWPLPSVALEYPKSDESVRWFAVFLLKGLVIKRLSKFKKHLLSTPETMVKPWAHLQPRTRPLLQALLSYSIDNRDRLLEVWKDDPKFLLNEYCEWLPVEHQYIVISMWPPIKSADDKSSPPSVTTTVASP